MASGAMPTGAALAGAALLAALLGCKDTGLIGEPERASAECEPECEADERCDTERGECEPCGEGSGCEGPADGGKCEGLGCSCEENDDCDDDDAPVCVDGRCAECEENDDCDGDDECQDNVCVAGDDGDNGSGKD